MNLLNGVTTRVNPDGLFYVEEAVSKRLYFIPFDKIQRYAGESARELGLHVGTKVEFTADSERRVGYAVLESDP